MLYYQSDGTVQLSKFKMADEEVELKTSVDTSESQPEIRHIEAENKGTEKAKDKGEVEEADNNQSGKGKVDDCAGAINDLGVGDAEGMAQVCNDETRFYSSNSEPSWNMEEGRYKKYISQGYWEINN